MVTSEVMLWEISAHQDELKRRLVERTYRRLAKAQIVRWYELAGMHSYGDQHTWISTPIFQNEPTKHYWRLVWRLSMPSTCLSRSNKIANVVLTCDRGIRDRAVAIKDRFELIVQKPSEFVASQGW